MDRPTLRARVDEVWDGEIVPTLTEYIRIPNVSPAYDDGWADAGHMDRAVDLARDWCERRRHRRAHGRGPAARGPHAAALWSRCPPPATRHRRPGHRRHRPALRPPRQAAADDGLAGRPRALGAGRSTTAASTGEAAPTTATRRSPRSPRSRRCGPRAAATPAASCSSSAARSPAARTCRPTSTSSATASARRRSSSASTPAARPTTGCGSRRRSAASSSASSGWTC